MTPSCCRRRSARSGQSSRCASGGPHGWGPAVAAAALAAPGGLCCGQFDATSTHPPNLCACTTPGCGLQEARGVADAEQQQQMLSEGSEAADFLRTSIVQAAMNDRGSYGARLGSLCAVGMSVCCRHQGSRPAPPALRAPDHNMPAAANAYAAHDTHSCRGWKGYTAGVVLCLLLVPRSTPTCLHPPLTEMTIGEEQIGGLVEEVSFQQRCWSPSMAAWHAAVWGRAALLAAAIGAIAGCPVSA